MVNTPDGTNSTNHASVGQGPRAQTLLALAWVFVALVPFFFFVSFAAQEGIYALTGYDSSPGTAPLWATLAAGLPGLAILLIPCVAGVVYGRRATRTGVRAGLVPEVFAALLGVGAVVLTLVNL